MRNATTTSIVSSYGIKPVVVDGRELATVLKFAVRRNSPLHAAYWAAFSMHDFQDRIRLVLQEQDVCKNRAHMRLYCMAMPGQGMDLRALYTEAQVLVREFEISQLKGQEWPEWYSMFMERTAAKAEPKSDDLPF
jgi:hypothetical protein